MSGTQNDVQAGSVEAYELGLLIEIDRLQRRESRLVESIIRLVESRNVDDTTYAGQRVADLAGVQASLKALRNLYEDATEVSLTDEVLDGLVEKYRLRR